MLLEGCCLPPRPVAWLHGRFTQAARHQARSLGPPLASSACLPVFSQDEASSDGDMPGLVSTVEDSGEEASDDEAGPSGHQARPPLGVQRSGQGVHLQTGRMQRLRKLLGMRHAPRPCSHMPLTTTTPPSAPSPFSPPPTPPLSTGGSSMDWPASLLSPTRAMRTATGPPCVAARWRDAVVARRCSSGGHATLG